MATLSKNYYSSALAKERVKFPLLPHIYIFILKDKQDKNIFYSFFIGCFYPKMTPQNIQLSSTNYKLSAKLGEFGPSHSIDLTRY